MATDASHRHSLKKPVAPTVEVRSSPPRDEDDTVVVVDEDSQDIVSDSQDDFTIADSQGRVPETQIVNMKDLIWGQCAHGGALHVGTSKDPLGVGYLKGLARTDEEFSVKTAIFT
jgi:hypothetical protein